MTEEDWAAQYDRDFAEMKARSVRLGTSKATLPCGTVINVPMDQEDYRRAVENPQTIDDWMLVEQHWRMQDRIITELNRALLTKKPKWRRRR